MNLRTEFEVPHFNDSQTYNFVKRLLKTIEKDKVKIKTLNDKSVELETRLRTIETFLDGMTRMSKGKFIMTPLKDLDLSVGEIENKF